MEEQWQITEERESVFKDIPYIVDKRGAHARENSSRWVMERKREKAHVSPCEEMLMSIIPAQLDRASSRTSS